MIALAIAVLGGILFLSPRVLLLYDRVGDTSARGDFILKPSSAWRWRYLGNIYFIAVERLHELSVMSNRLMLRIEQSQVCNVPWIAHVLVCLRVLQPVSSTSNDF